MKIEQFITCPSIGFFENGFQKKWNLSKYFDNTKPLYNSDQGELNGYRDLTEFTVFKNNKVII